MEWPHCIEMDHTALEHLRSHAHQYDGICEHSAAMNIYWTYMVI